MDLKSALGVLFIFLTFSASTANAEPLRLEEALASVNEAHAAIKFGEQEQITFIKREVIKCQQKMHQQLVFTPPATSCYADHFLTPLQRQQLLVLRRMLDVSLADFRAGLENEALAIAFIDFDRSQTRQQLGERSELDVSKFNAAYQPVRVRFVASEKAQRLTRAMLAMVQGTPGELSADILLPDFSEWVASPVGSEKTLIEEALKSNPILGLIDQAEEETLLHIVKDQLAFAVLELLMSLDVLATKKEAADAMFEYRSLYLDRSRTLYQLEVKADLGDSMVEQTSARLSQLEVLYERVMQRATLNALRGKPLLDDLERK